MANLNKALSVSRLGKGVVKEAVKESAAREAGPEYLKTTKQMV